MGMRIPNLPPTLLPRARGGGVACGSDPGGEMDTVDQGFSQPDPGDPHPQPRYPGGGAARVSGVQTEVTIFPDLATESSL